MADGHAVQEMLKVTTILYEAAKTTHQDTETQEESPELDIMSLETSLSAKVRLSFMWSKVNDPCDLSVFKFL